MASLEDYLQDGYKSGCLSYSDFVSLNPGMKGTNHLCNQVCKAPTWQWGSLSSVGDPQNHSIQVRGPQDKASTSPGSHNDFDLGEPHTLAKQ